MPPRVSVIIPTYNHRDYVLETLESVFAQTFTDYEVIVVNDGSPDDPAELLRPLAEAGRIKYIEQPNAGQAAARNRGLAEAKGEFIAFLDDDDLWPPDKLEWQVRAMRSGSFVAVYGFSEMFGTSDAQRVPEAPGPSGCVFGHFLEGNWMSSPGQVLIRRTALEDVGGFDGSIWGADDWDLYLRLAKCGMFLYEDRIALRYRCHTANASRDVVRMYLNCCRVYRKHASWLRWLRPRHVFQWLYGSAVMDLARQSMQNGDWRRARQLWWKLVVNRPMLLRRGEVLHGLLVSTARGVRAIKT
jgi:glycosyltransferase involved in cell wall biosynthesis